MRSIEAPVVPMQEAATVKARRTSVLTSGVAAGLPRTTIPPDTA